MSLGEERVYQTLWHARESDGIVPEGKRSKTFSLGYDRIARLVRLNEKSVRLLLPKLISKRILEVVAAENSAERVGRTYRIFNYEEILERQRAANLTNVVKNGRAVEFVWPRGATEGETPTVGAYADQRSVSPPLEPPAADLRPGVGDTPTVAGTPPARDRGDGGRSAGTRSQLSRDEAYPGDLPSKVRAIVSSFDEDAIRTLWTRCVQQAPDCTSDEIEYCLGLKAQQLLGRGKPVTNPVGLMLWAVPKCFEGPAALHLAFREQKLAQEEAQRRAEEEFSQQVEEYRRLVADPSTSPEDRSWYEELLRRVD